MKTTKEKISRTERPKWLKIKEDELKKIIAELVKTEEQPAKIGLILRDKYGVPTTRVYGKKLVQYLKELGITDNIEVKNAERKFEKMKEHLKQNITDRRTKHKLQKAQSKMNIIRKYAAKRKK